MKYRLWSDRAHRHHFDSLCETWLLSKILLVLLRRCLSFKPRYSSVSLNHEKVKLVKVKISNGLESSTADKEKFV